MPASAGQQRSRPVGTPRDSDMVPGGGSKITCNRNQRATSLHFRPSYALFLHFRPHYALRRSAGHASRWGSCAGERSRAATLCFTRRPRYGLSDMKPNPQSGRCGHFMVPIRSSSSSWPEGLPPKEAKKPSQDMRRGAFEVTKNSDTCCRRAIPLTRRDHTPEYAREWLRSHRANCPMRPC